MSEPAIEVNNLTKTFGDFTAVDQLNFTVNRGEIMGYLGVKRLWQNYHYPHVAGAAATQRRAGQSVGARY